MRGVIKMQIDKIVVVKKLAKELIELINELTIAEKELNERWKGSCYSSPKHRAAVKRRSMDLTRALAEMRKP
jgi:hypothetical protein